MSERAPLLVVESLTRHHDGGAVRALVGVSFPAHAGEVVAVTGPYGCGKSTLPALVGLLGFVFQFHHRRPTMTLLEKVAAPAVPLGAPRARRAAVAPALLNDSPVIVADELTGNLNGRNGQIVVDLLVEHVRPQGALVLLATHNPDVARVAHRRIELLDGEMVHAGGRNGDVFAGVNRC